MLTTGSFQLSTQRRGLFAPHHCKISVRSASLLQAAARAAVHRRNSICATLAAGLYALDSARSGRDSRLDTNLHEARQRGLGTSKVSWQWPVHPHGPCGGLELPGYHWNNFWLWQLCRQRAALSSRFYVLRRSLSAPRPSCLSLW